MDVIGSASVDDLSRCSGVLGGRCDTLAGVLVVASVILFHSTCDEAIVSLLYDILKW